MLIPEGFSFHLLTEGIPWRVEPVSEHHGAILEYPVPRVEARDLLANLVC